MYTKTGQHFVQVLLLSALPTRPHQLCNQVQAPPPQVQPSPISLLQIFCTSFHVFSNIFTFSNIEATYFTSEIKTVFGFIFHFGTDQWQHFEAWYQNYQNHDNSHYHPA